MGLRLRRDQVAYRCNLVTVGADGTMVDFAGGHPSSEAAAEVIAALDAELGGATPSAVSFHPGVQYRHIVLAPRELADAECTPPHDLIGQPATPPTGPAAAALQDLMEASRAVLSRFDLAANQIWLWGQGPQPKIPSFAATYGLRAGLVSAVDLVRGLGALAQIPVIAVEGATGWYDTNYEGKRDACLEALADGCDLFLIHVEASDEAGHAGDLAEKMRALENWDRRIIGPLVQGLDGLGPWRLLLLPDHPTALRTRTHTADPVPYLLVGSNRAGPGGVFSESSVAGEEPLAGHSLMGRLIGRGPRY
jgi:2,3-bisphosphoglycerate-independent phosphoglycerate mutase